MDLQLNIDNSKQTTQSKNTDYSDKNGIIIKVGDMLSHESTPEFPFGEVILNDVGIPVIVADKIFFLEKHYAQCIVIATNSNKKIIVKKIAMKLPMLIIGLSVVFMLYETFRIRTILSLP